MRVRLIAAVVATALSAHASAWAASGSASSEPAEGQPGFSLSDFKLVTAQDLYDVCTVEASDPNVAVAEAFCYGYFTGGKHYHDEVAAVAPMGPIACPPAPATRQELVVVFVDYLKRNPQLAAGRPMDVIFEAIGAQWPCPAKP